MSNIDALTAFGLTRQEAALYLTLYAEGDISGYEAAKLTGISRSNAYSALAGLVDKGAAYLIEGTVNKYTPVNIEEFCNNKLRYLKELKETLEKQMPLQRTDSEGYITIQGEKHIIDKMKNLLMNANERVYLSLSKNLVELIRRELEYLVKIGIKVVIISDEELQIPGVRVYKTQKADEQIRLIVDSKNVLTGEFNGDESSCLYSSKKNLVDVFKESLRNEMKLIELTKGTML